ncbi:MAG TPA: tRNA (adenosine(37)-N6)-threonylcarbamoyltransferase complex dimerization subunit type 1 TsaB [Blastocatellia bacterium]|nr:tRNA (adenosine(37)-N6)-threonylcarbamoyltransferase complex dimerization subunit type 1 TsaB [Blastocatellia bacterium]
MKPPDREQRAPLILAVDTSAKITSLAIAQGAQILAEFTGDSDEKRSEKLWTEIGALLADAGYGINDVDLYAVCVGPGGFTGLRVGVAAVKGYAAAAGKPVVGVTSLEAAAFAAGPTPVVCAMVNAYKGEVFAQQFAFDAAGAPVPLSEPIVAPAEQILERVAALDDVLFAGSGAIENLERIRQAGGEKFREAPGNSGWRVAQPAALAAGRIAQLALIKFQRGEAESAESLRACYVRPSDAEIKLSQGLIGAKKMRDA